MMKYRPYGRSKRTVSEIGFGAWQLGNGRDWAQQTGDSEAIALVHRALEEGCNFFDTAPGYGRGRSEDILGQALVGKRDQIVLNTKVGHSANGQTDFSPAALRESVEESLRRLRTDYLDSVLLHNPPFTCLHGTSPQMETLAALQKEGKLLAYGASVDSSREIKEVLTTSSSNVLEVLFNVFHQETAAAFALAAKQQVALIIKVPLDSGWLTGKYGPQTAFSDIRSRWSPAVVARRFELLEQIRFLEDAQTTMTQAALRFILAHPAVTTVIPGIKDEAQLLTNLSAVEETMADATVERLHNLWQEQIARDPLPW